MIAIPAIDIRGGKVVRLRQGNFTEQTTYSDSPVEIAAQWAACGARMLHIVDLDGAVEGMVKNLDLVRKIAAAVKMQVELGGGIRDEDSIRRAMDSGVSKVVIGTRALDENFLRPVLKKFGDSIVVGIDASQGMVVTKGWVVKTASKAVDLARRVESLGARTINYTDISTDGMLAGPNIDSLRELLEVTTMDVVVAGGVSSIEDIRRLKALEEDGLRGIIIGKALYEGKVDLTEAIRICEGVSR